MTLPRRNDCVTERGSSLSQMSYCKNHLVVPQRLPRFRSCRRVKPRSGSNACIFADHRYAGRMRDGIPSVGFKPSATWTLRLEYTVPLAKDFIKKIRISGATAYCVWAPSAAPVCTVGSECADEPNFLTKPCRCAPDVRWQQLKFARKTTWQELLACEITA